jgi:hypothetical protein
MANNKRQTVSSYFSLDEGVAQSIQEMSSDLGISKSALANYILDRVFRTMIASEIVEDDIKARELMNSKKNIMFPGHGSQTWSLNLTLEFTEKL